MTTADALPVPTARFRPGRTDESEHNVNGLTPHQVETPAVCGPTAGGLRNAIALRRVRDPGS